MPDGPPRKAEMYTHVQGENLRKSLTLSEYAKAARRCSGRGQKVEQKHERGNSRGGEKTTLSPFKGQIKGHMRRRVVKCRGSFTPGVNKKKRMSDVSKRGDYNTPS